MDRNIREQFDIGGTAIHVHKYLGPKQQNDTDDPSEPNYGSGLEKDLFSGEEINPEGWINETKVQDLLFMENRDRKYDPDIYELRGVYNVSDNDFDLTQFGLFLTNDTLFITFHINDMVERLGRKLMPGDVLELPHLRDELLLSQDRNAVNKFYVVQDANRGSEGFSQTWYPHIWRVKVAPLTDTQEYSDILGTANDPNSLKQSLSNYKTELNISEAIVQAAEEADPLGVPLQDHLFGIPEEDTDYEHGETLQQGDQFPQDPNDGDYFVRTDFTPNRLFVYRGSRWHRLYDNITANTWSDKTYNASGFINNDATTVVDNQEFPERQALSQVIKPKSDF
jgi:Fe-S cluster biosynthesis and repair protein YggX